MANDCASCKFTWAVAGECRRFPPAAIMVGASLQSVWPSVTDSDWCGEYQPVGGGSSVTLTSLTPDTLASGSTPATVDVVGTGFDSSCVVLANGVSRATFYIDNAHLQYTARPDLEQPGTVQITVEGAAGTSNALPFTYT